MRSLDVGMKPLENILVMGGEIELGVALLGPKHFFPMGNLDPDILGRLDFHFASSETFFAALSSRKPR